MNATGDRPSGSSKRVLATGASGFVGRHVLPELVARGHTVHAIRHRNATGELPGITWHRGDLFDGSATERLIRQVGPTHLVHLAWYASPGQFWASPANTAWMTATLTLLQQFVAAGGRRFVVAGTCAEYDWRYGYCVEELTPLTPATLYGVAKHATSMLAREIAVLNGVSWAWARLFFLYGPHEHPDRLVPTVIRGLRAGTVVPCSSGTQIRDFLHVADAAAALAALLESDAQGAINVGSGHPVAVRQVVQTIANRFERPDLVDFGGLATRHDPPLVLASVERLRQAVRWTPRFSLEEGLGDTIRWWSRQSGGEGQDEHGSSSGGL